MYILHHPTSQRKGPRGYQPWWDRDRTRCLSLFVKLLRNASNDLQGILSNLIMLNNSTNSPNLDPTNQDIIKYTYYLLLGWAYQQQSHEISVRSRRKATKRKEDQYEHLPVWTSFPYYYHILFNALLSWMLKLQTWLLRQPR